MIYDLAIIGGGPAGVAAGVYAARKRLKTVFITKDFAGQSTVSLDIQNWIGTVSITGEQLSKNLKEHLQSYADDVVTIAEGEYATILSKKEGGGFVISTPTKQYEAKTVLIASGSYRRRLDVPGADQYEHKGLTYCASCDGPLFADTDVVVVGGGNAAFESAAQLLAYSKSVTLLNRSGQFRADPITVKKTLAHPKMKAITHAIPVEVKGDVFTQAIVYKNAQTGEVTELPVSGIFVEIGLIPNTGFAKDVVKLNEHGHIITDPRTQQTTTEGVWAAGDCTDGLYHQNNIAAGDAVKALEDIYLYIYRNK